MPITDKQRRYLFANNKGDVARKLMYRQDGGGVGPLAPAPSQVPGAAQGAINTYMAGTAPLATSYTGDIAADQASRIQYQKDLRDLEEAGVENAQDYVYQDWTEDQRDDHWQDPANWNQTQWDRMISTGTTGHLIHKDDRADHMRGIKAVTPEQVAAYMKAAGGQSAPGVTGAILGGIGGAMRGRMQKAIDAGGTPIMVNGNLAVLDPKTGSVIGNTGNIGAAGLRKAATMMKDAQGNPIYTAPKAKFGNLFSGVKDIIGFKTQADIDAAAAKAAEAERLKALQHYAQASDRGGLDYSHESSDDFRDRTQAASSRIDWSAPSDADLEDVYGGTDWSHGWNRGGPVMSEDVWGTDPLAELSEVKVVQRQGGAPAIQVAAPQGSPLMNIGTQLATKAATGYIMPSSLGGAGGWMGLNAGGWVGRRTAYLVNGGMAQPGAEMQAYNEMQSMTGPNPVGAEFMMPEGSPMPEEYAPLPDHGYIPSGASQSYKEQMEADKLYIQQEKAMQDEDRKERAFGAAERRKDDTHTLQMQQKKEAHEETMKQKRAGPLAPNASTSIRG